MTHAHPEQVKSDRNFTLADEYLPHAVAAVRLLRAHPAVAADRVFLAGHSLGGTVAPRVAAAEPGVAGLVILAGGAEPLQWAMVRQVRYLASLDPATAASAQPVIEAMEAGSVFTAVLESATPYLTFGNGTKAEIFHVAGTSGSESYFGEGKNIANFSRSSPSTSART